MTKPGSETNLNGNDLLYTFEREKLGYEIRDRRRSSGLYRGALADRAGVSITELKRIERNEYELPKDEDVIFKILRMLLKMTKK